MQLERFSEFAAAFPEPVHREAARHLLQHARQRKVQEDVCFGLWHPGVGSRRLSAVVGRLLLPEEGDRIVAGNVSFTEQYFRRVLTAALEHKAGIALMHSHLGPGWQDLSVDDHASEGSFAGRILAATGHPLVGLTLGTDESWSARFWARGRRSFEPLWCGSVRVAGNGLGISYHPTLHPAPEPTERLRRTIGVWGRAGQANLARLRIAIVGLGSVGSIVAEALARMGVGSVILIDFDQVEELNLDRVLNATSLSIGELKVDVAAISYGKHATAEGVDVTRVNASVVEEEGYVAALDADVVFSCVDRHLPRRVLNHIANAHAIPVIDGGILVRLRRERLVGADWHVRTIAPGRRCLECWSAYDASVVGMEREGLLDDPSYLEQLEADDVLLRHENVFPFSTSVAGLEVLQLASLLLGPVQNIGDQNFHFATGTLDLKQDKGCDASCLFRDLVGTADSVVRPVSRDVAAEKARARGLACEVMQWRILDSTCGSELRQGR